MAQDSRRARQERLVDILGREPFLTDEQLAAKFSVSVQTIRLDRMALGIPELRERIKDLAVSRYHEVRSLAPDEVFGDIVELELGVQGLSIWRADREHAFSRSSIVRGHYLFAQANSLAVAIVDADQALTARATVKFMRSVNAGSYMIAHARVKGERHGYVRVGVQTKVHHESVFEADFLIMRKGIEITGGSAGEGCD
ncbi:transcription factor FapR [Sulfoacidibacillus thermotolerans]|uniref:transcription factor FapR n=1 Tax=Sulfoacidibacillus thermotolerans TaxID=1765684 RepID=UPI000D694564|nr:transcription factor FapR [Sulfoacidibacillus thermotolerans]